MEKEGKWTVTQTKKEENIMCKQTPKGILHKTERV